jgi:hypothetical protein
VQRLSDQRRSLALASLAVGAVFSAAFFRRKRRGEEAEFELVPPVAPTPPVAQPKAETPPAPRAPLLEPATGELSAEEASILSVLAQHGRHDDDRTAIAVATSLERDTVDVTTVLRKLGAEGVVSGELYTAAGDKIWAVTERGVRRLGAQH